MIAAIQLNFDLRLPKVQLQYLTLDFDRPHKDPDLVFRELCRIRRGELFELLCHRGMLVRCELMSQDGFPASLFEAIFIIQLIGIRR